MHRGDGQDLPHRLHQTRMHGDVALDALRAHDEARTQGTGIAQPIARTHAGALRHGVHRDQRSVVVEIPCNDADGTPVQTRIRGLLARREEAIGVEIQPNREIRVDYGRVLNDTPSVGVLLRVLSRASLSTNPG